MNIFPDPLPPEDRLRIGIVSRLYHVLLGRTADVGGLSATVQRLREGIPLDTIMAEALRSDEFLASHPTPVQSADDVDALYRAACHAPPPDVDRTLPPGAYAAQVLTAAEIGRPSRISDILFAEGLDPADGSDYRVWLADFHEPDPATREAAARSGSGPLAVSLVLLGGWTGGAALVATLDSVRGQLCRRFELVVAGSRRFCASASRLASSATVVSRRETDAAALLNAALPHCQGRFILPLRPGARLSPDAVWHIAQAAEDTGASALLLDHDCIDSAGLRQDPTLHAGWDPEVALCRIDWAAGLALDTALARRTGEALVAAGPTAHAPSWRCG